MLHESHNKEKRVLKQENQKLKNDTWVQKIINTKLKRNYATMMEVEADLQRELQQVKTSVPEENLQLVGSISQPQEGRWCGKETVEEKLSLDNFEFVKKLGKGGFGVVVLTKVKLPRGPEQLYAIKALKKHRITFSSILISVQRRKP